MARGLESRIYWAGEGSWVYEAPHGLPVPCTSDPRNPRPDKKKQTGNIDERLGEEARVLKGPVLALKYVGGSQKRKKPPILSTQHSGRKYKF